MQELLAALSVILKWFGDSDEVRRAVVFSAWRKAAGEALYDRASPISFDGRKLFIAVPDRTWKRNLESLSSEMIYRINALLGMSAVKFIEFVIDSGRATNAGPVDGRNAESASRALNNITEPIRRAAETISDDELRRTFLLAAGSCLAREERTNVPG
jgi:hypothetical protein